MHDRGARVLAPMVLIAEDEFLLAQEIEDIVRDIGCRVMGPVGSVTELLGLINGTPCDLALLDIHLRHGETVYAAADRLRLLKIPFAFMTAYGKAEIDPRYASTRVICKPATAEEIESCLSALMPGKQTDQEIRPLS